MQINIMYFASLRDSSKTSFETLETQAKTVDELFNFLNEKYRFAIDKEYLRVAINEEYKSFDTSLSSNDTLVFIPPVAGG